jgi:hypothetical protein
MSTVRMGGGPAWTFVQESYWSNFGAGSGPGGSNCGAPLAGTLSCTVNLLKPVTPGNLLVILPLFYSGAPITLTSINGEAMQTCTACELLYYGAIQLVAGYVLNAKGGENSITCNFSAESSGWQACGVVEAHWSGTGGLPLIPETPQ